MAENNIYIVRKFPDFEEKIDFLFRTDECFRDLCKDYLLCTSKVIEMNKSNAGLQSLFEEYQDLQKSLELEIFTILNKDGNSEI